MSTPDIESNTDLPNTSKRTLSIQISGDTIKRNKNLILAIASGLSLFLLLASWAWIVPPKSAPDDDFHLTTIWCAWGDSEYCIDESPTSVRVPEQLIGLNCRNFDFTMPDARCAWTAPFKLTATDRLRQATGYSSPIFYQVQRVFVGDDIETSTFKMRLFNSGVASVLFTVAMWVTTSAIRRSLALTWMIVATPLVAFTIASTTPQSWAVIGVAFSWIFFAAWLTTDSDRRRQVLALAGFFITLVLASAARSDSALYALITYAAVIALLCRRWREFRKRLLVVLIPALVIAMVGLSYRALSVIAVPESRHDSEPPAIPSHLLTSMLSDIPAFFAGVTGFFPASGVPWSGHVTWGLGWEGFPSPSFSYLALILALGGAITWGIQSISRPRLISLAILITPLIVIPVVTVVWITTFETGVQLRYFLPLLLAVIPFLLIRCTRSCDSLSTFQLCLVAVLATTGSVVTFTSATVRYQVGLTPLWDVAWARVWFDPAASNVPHTPTVILGAMSTVLFIATMVFQVVRSQPSTRLPIS